MTGCRQKPPAGQVLKKRKRNQISDTHTKEKLFLNVAAFMTKKNGLARDDSQTVIYV